jgi:6-phospho-beta-glucosidase
LTEQPGLPDLNLCLVARDAERLRVIATHAARRVAQRRPSWTVEWTVSLSAAASRADVGVLMLRVGGLQARLHDEEFPAKFGLTGDEGLSVGGLANAWRTLPVLLDMAKVLKDAAPGCSWLNLTSPLGLTTRLLRDSGLDVVGVCELPTVSRRRLLAAASERSIDNGLAYGGLNHLGWFWAQDREAEKILEAGAKAGIIDESTLERYGAAPLRYFYEVFDPIAGRRIGIARKPGRPRELIALDAELLARFAAEPGGEIEALGRRETSWFDLIVAPLVNTALGGPTFRAHANVVNAGLLPELPREIVVEVEAEFTGCVARPMAPGSLPPAVAEFLEAVSRSDMLAYEAIRQADEASMAASIEALPLAAAREQARELVSHVCAPRPGVGVRGEAP